MREILFRGKRLDNGAWVYGCFNHIPCGRFRNDEYCIQTIKGNGRIGRLYDVDPDTVGQYTGLTDKNGKNIFDGDIVQMPFWRSKKSGLFMKGIVEFHNAAFSVLWEHTEYGRNFLGYIDDLEVIGNIHDNPELLEVQK